ncbi:CbtA family protein [Aeromicrobium sp. P5_D10]
MNARAFLVRGLLAGLIAGLAAFFVAYQVGEPHVEKAISLEASGAEAPTDEAAAADHEHGDEAAAHTHSHGDEDSGTEVSRHNQRTWGLLTGTLSVGIALGGLAALVSAAVVGRLGRMMPGQSTSLIALIGFVSVALVPFLKYPSTPPAVGSGDTIGERTGLYFGFLLVSILAAAVTTYLAVKLRDRIGTYAAVVAGIAVYLVVMVVAGQLFSTVNEIGDFPADTLWFFRRGSLFTLATMWGVLGVVLTGLISRLYAADLAKAARRELAASL